MPDINLPINIDDLIKRHTVEGERLEFKKGWNPEAVIHTLCAFANDFHNLGGGYIVIGIEEKDGRPILPPVGIPASKIDKIQKEILTLGYRIQPVYHPVIAPYVIQDRHVLILWAPGGQTRPYKAPVSLAKDAKEFAYYKKEEKAETEMTGTNSQYQSQHQSQYQSDKQTLSIRICLYLAQTTDASISEISEHLGQKRTSGRLKLVLRDLINQSIIEYTVPDKPQSRLQRYRLTEKGREYLEGQR